MAETAGVNISSEQEKKQTQVLKYLYGFPDFGGGVWKAYFSTFLPMLYTDVYFLPVLLGGALETLQSVMSWIMGPIWGTFLDRVTLKTGKYWMWIIVFATVAAGGYMLLFSIPMLSSNPSGMAMAAFLVACLTAASVSISDNTSTAIFPKLAKTPETRTFLSTSKSVGREASKTIFNYITPVLLAAMISSRGSDVAGWGSTALILAPIGLIFYIFYAFYLKGTFVEKQAIADRDLIKESAKKRTSMLDVFKVLLTNRPLMVMFLYFAILKFYDLALTVQSSAFFFRYYVGSMPRMGSYMTSRTFAELIGSLVSIYWLKIIKDTKKALLTAGLMHVITIGIVAFTMGKVSIDTTLTILIVNQFFVGCLSNYVLPLVAAGCDYGALKAGERFDGLGMSTYGLGLRCAVLIGTPVRTAMLAHSGYDAAAYAAGAAVPENVLKTLANFQSLYPFIFSIIGLALVFFLYPINDAKHKEIREELKAKGLG